MDTYNDLKAENEKLKAENDAYKAAYGEAAAPPVKQEFPKCVYKTDGEAVATQTVNSQEELDALGPGWGEHPETVESAEPKGDVLDGNVSDVAAVIASMTDIDALKALKSQERKGKARQGVYDAIDARIVELKAKA